MFVLRSTILFLSFFTFPLARSFSHAHTLFAKIKKWLVCVFSASMGGGEDGY